MEALGGKRKTLAESKLGEGRWAQAPRSRLAGLDGMSRPGGGCGGVLLLLTEVHTELAAGQRYMGTGVQAWS